MVRFADIGGIVDYYYLDFLFISLYVHRWHSYWPMNGNIVCYGEKKP
jgi:hypothetical protein